MTVYESFLNRYGKYTEIQEKAIPRIAGGESCLLMAPTGSGKTEAAILALLDRISNTDAPGIKILYITPLRALNRDLLGRLEGLCKEAGVTVSVRHGDTTQSERGKQARRAPQVLITTPETLQSILPTKSFHNSLKNVMAVIVDEIHELYPNKRGAQLSLALERLAQLAPGFQRIGISATVGDPELVRSFLCNERKCEIIGIDARKKSEIKVELPRHHTNRIEPLAQRFVLDSDALARLDSVARHIANSKSTIIFANTRQVVEAVGSRLLYFNGIESFGGIGIHHSSLDRNERIDVENRFKNGEIKSMIATSSLELGIDIGNVDLVIQYGSPRQALRLVQRVGRSGHTVHGTAKGIITATNTLDAIEAVVIADAVSSGRLERFGVQKGALDVLANQICGIALDRSMITAQELLALVKGSFVYGGTTKEQLAYLLEFMNRQRMVGFDGERVTSGPRTRMYYYGHLSVIPDSKRYIVKSVADNRVISSLDENFVVSSIDENSVFITKGLPWKVVSIDENVISVEPSSDLEAAIPDWSGEDIPVSPETAASVFDIIGDPASVAQKGFSPAQLNQEIREFADGQRKAGMPSKKHLLMERSDEYCILYTGLGTLANEGLSRLLAHGLSAKLGKSINIKSSPYLIFIEVPLQIDMEKTLLDLSKADARSALSGMVHDTELFRYRFITTAKLFGVIEREATVSKSLAKRIIKVLEKTPVYDETMRSLIEGYFDIKTLGEFFASLGSGQKIKIKTVYSRSLSPFAKLVLNSAYYTKELIMPLLPSDELVESFSKYLLSKSMKLLCTHCGFSFTRKISEIKDSPEIRCPSCQSPLIAPYTDNYLEIIRKRNAEKRLTKAEMETYKEIMKQASLFDSYGGKAAVALSTYGVGPNAAARILMMLRRQERLFYTDLVEAQKQFIRNRKYWSA